MNEIGNWVVAQTVHWLEHWKGLIGRTLQISVNVSPVQFQTGGNFDDWSKHLADAKIAGNQIAIEITEGLLLHAEPDIQRKLLEYRDAGIQVSIDDFGTGYSSLAYLKKFDIDYLKIDKAFVNNLETDSDDRALTEAIVVMAHKLGLKVIAEGVETMGQRDLLARIGCDYGQGYLFARPMPPAAFEELLRKQG